MDDSRDIDGDTVSTVAAQEKKEAQDTKTQHYLQYLL